jgi:hypothetical protein
MKITCFCVPLCKVREGQWGSYPLISNIWSLFTKADYPSPEFFPACSLLV